MRKSKTIAKAGKNVPYPDSRDIVAAALNNERKRALEKKDRFSKGDIADDLGITSASLWNYSEGVRVPPRETAKAMGDRFYGVDSPRSHRFQSELEKIRNAASIPERKTSILGRIDSEGEISVTVSSFPPFCGSAKFFLDTLISRLFSSGGLRAAMEVPKDPQFDIRKALANDQTDLILGYLATIERAVLISFFSTPFRICLGGVIRRDDKGQEERIQNALLLDRKPGQHPALNVIVIRQDVGAIYANTLKTQNLPDIHITPVDTTEEMIEAMTSPDPPNKGIRVALLNELTSFTILEKLNGVPIMPLSSLKAARETMRHKLPAYFLGLGCSRSRPQLREMIEQLLVLFLSTEIESTANALKDLQKALMETVEKAARYYDEFSDQSKQFRAAYNWTLYALCLDKNHSYPDSAIPWKPILKRTRARILEDLSLDVIETQIKLTVGHDHPLTREQLHTVLEDFDIDLNLEGVQQEYVREDRHILSRVIQGALKGSPIGMPLESYESGEKKGQPKPGGMAKAINPRGNEDLLRVVDGFLAELGIFYRNHVSQDDMDVLGVPPDKSPMVKLTDFRKAMPHFGEQEHSRIVLAQIGNEESPLYIGGACLRPYKGSRSDLELVYLWTHPRYRDLGVGLQIIHEARAFAAAEKFSYLVAEVFQTLNEQVTYFLKRGFEVDAKTKSVGRLVLHRTV